MKRSIQLLCGALLLCQALGAAQDQLNPHDGAEALRLKSLLESLRGSTSATTSKPSGSSTTTAKAKILPGSEEDHDYNFQNDRLPALSEDETNSLGHDANPLHFLKQLPAEATTIQVQSTTEAAKPQVEDEKPLPPPSGSPIYITIPIYINTSGQLPLKLVVGGQELPLQRRAPSQKKSPPTKSPNSYFNRLLEQIEPPKRRTTNRHRSPSRSKIQALSPEANEK